MNESKEMTNSETKSVNGKKLRTCQIFLLSGQEFHFDVPKQSLGSVLLKHIYELLNIVETDYFGLYFQDFSFQNYWLEPNKTIKKQLKNGPWSFHFAVKFYPPDPGQLHEDITRYYMVLQLMDDIVGGRLKCSFVTHALLGSYVVQSEIGDYDATRMTGNYVADFSFAPNQTPELEERVRALHLTHRGQTPSQAELNFLENAKKLAMYGVDLHTSKDSDGIGISLGISWNGIHVYRDDSLINRFPWPRVIKLSYVRSKFYVTIRPLDGECQMNMIGFKMANHRAAKRVWKSGVEHHAFFRLARNDTKPKGKLIRVGSHFRYQGRTQMETRRAVTKQDPRPPPAIVRSHSRRSRQEDGNVMIRSQEQLAPVFEEASEELPPPLPEKKAKMTKQVEECVVTVTTTTVEEQVRSTLQATKGDIQENGDGEDRKSMTSSSGKSSSVDRKSHDHDDHESHDRDHDDNESHDDDRDDDDAFSTELPLTDHQKRVRKIKIDFLSSTPTSPSGAESHSSLEALDARLPPRPLPRNRRHSSDDRSTEDERSAEEDQHWSADDQSAADHHLTRYRSSSSSSSQLEPEDDAAVENSSLVVENSSPPSTSLSSSDEHLFHSTEHLAVEESAPPHPENEFSQNHPEEDGLVQQDLEDVSSAPQLPADVSSAQQDLEDKFDPPEESSLQHPPEEPAPQDAEEDGGKEKEQDSSSSSSSSSHSDSDGDEDVEEQEGEEKDEEDEEGGRVVNGIATVETRAVRVDQVVIPRDTNQVHRVSLSSDHEGNMVSSPPPAPEMRWSRSNSASSLSSEADNVPVSGYVEPPTVKTEAVVVVDSRAQHPPETGTTQPPLVQTKTITYEAQAGHVGGRVMGELVTSQVITRETDCVVTTTEITKVMHGENISETLVEKQVVQMGDNGHDVDHHSVMADAIRDAQKINPHITKVVVQQESAYEA